MEKYWSPMVQKHFSDQHLGMLAYIDWIKILPTTTWYAGDQ